MSPAEAKTAQLEAVTQFATIDTLAQRIEDALGTDPCQAVA
jgi:hypothetical protein